MHRKTLLSLLLAACCFSGLNAQTQEGNILIGTSGSVGYLGNQRGLSLYGNVNAGYFIKDNFAVGSEFQQFKVDLGESGISAAYNIGVFGRKYINLKNSKWKPFFELATGYQYTNNARININNNSAYARVEAGAAYFLNENVSFDVSGYNQISIEGAGINGNQSGIKFGVHFHFNGKKKK